MLDEATLRRLYQDELLSIRTIAVLADMSLRTVYDQLIYYRIPRRPTGFRSPRAQLDCTPLDETTLREWYEVEGLSIRAIAERASVSTRMVYDALRQYRIPRRKSGRPQSKLPSITSENGALDETTLRLLYEVESRSISDIATYLHCSPSRVRKALVRMSIPRRRRGRPTGKID